MASLKPDIHRDEFERGDLPCVAPAECAVASGVFGFDENGAITPSIDDVRAMTLEHARDLAGILYAMSTLRECAVRSIEPGSRRSRRKRSQREATAQRLTTEIARLSQHYDDALAAFADGFGLEAADALDQFVRRNCSASLVGPSVAIQQELF